MRKISVMLYSTKVPKLLGIDYGTKRVGVAITDDSGSVAFPKTTFPNDRTLIPAIVNLIRKENVAHVIIGESHNARNEPNPVMKNVKSFAGDIERAVAVVVKYEPEFYSSQEARTLVSRDHVDAQAAAIILNSYIEKSKRILKPS